MAKKKGRGYEQQGGKNLLHIDTWWHADQSVCREVEGRKAGGCVCHGGGGEESIPVCAEQTVNSLNGEWMSAL